MFLQHRVQLAADNVRYAAATGNTCAVKTDGAAEAFLREVVLHDGQRRGVQCRFAGTHAHARHEQAGVSGGHATSGGHEAPNRNTAEDNPAAIAAVRQPCQRNAEEGVEHREGAAQQETDLRIGNAKIGPDVGHQHGDDFAVDERQNVG